MCVNISRRSFFWHWKFTNILYCHFLAGIKLLLFTYFDSNFLFKLINFLVDSKLFFLCLHHNLLELIECSHHTKFFLFLHCLPLQLTQLFHYTYFFFFFYCFTFNFIPFLHSIFYSLLVVEFLGFLLNGFFDLNNALSHTYNFLFNNYIYYTRTILNM